jgi:hypothetical protein
MMFFKNIFSFALTWKGYDWLVESGTIKPIFVAIGSVQVGVCLLTVPQCKASPLFVDKADVGRFLWEAHPALHVEA